MTLSPLGLSFGRSAARLVGIALYLSALTATVAVGIGYDGSILVWIATLSDIGDGLLTDSSWLLPALLAVNVALIVVVAAQSFADTEPDQIARTHRVIAFVSQTVGAFALMTVAFSTLSALHVPEAARHLIPVYFLAFLVGLFGLWANIVVFGKPKESLRLSKASRDLAVASLKRLHEPTHTKIQAWVTAVVSMLAIALAASLIPIVVSSMMSVSFVGPMQWILTCLGIAASTSIVAGAGAAILMVSERGVSSWLIYLLIVGVVTVFPAAVIVLNSRSSPLVAIVLTLLFIAPAIGTWVPFGSRFPKLSRLGFGNAVRSLVHSYVSARVERLEMLIGQLELEVTPLDMSAARERRL
jgi:hypothetical protein